MTDTEQRGLRQLLALLEDTDQWVQRVTEADADSIKPQPESPLAGDDLQAGMYPVSGVAWNHLTVAIDHLSTLRAATVGCGEHETVRLHLHLNGQFTLLRAMIENASAVLWLLGPLTRPDRLLRRLQFAAGDIRNNEAVRTLINSPGRKTKDQRLNELHGIATLCGLDPKLAVRGPGYEDIVRAAGEVTEIGADLAVILWRACSGLAHGDLWASIVLPGRVHLASISSDTLDLELSPDVEGLCTATIVGKILIARAFALYELRCRPEPK